MKNACWKAAAGILILSMVLTSGCTMMMGSPSMTMISRDITADSPNVEVIGEMDKETDTMTWCLLLLMFGKSRPTHEGPTKRLLEKYDADMLVDAEMTSTVFGIPYVFMQWRFTTSGRPARFIDGGAK